MDATLQYVVSGLVLGAAYAVIALGIVLVYKSTHVFNFAQGQFVVWGALVSYWAINRFGVLIAAPLIMCVAIAMGYLVDRLALRPLIGQPLIAALLMTLALSYLLDGVAYMSWGTAVRAYPELFSMPKGFMPLSPSGIITFGPVKLGYAHLLSVIGALLVFLLVLLFYRRSRLGKAMRATAEDHQVSQSLGIRVKRIFSLSWIIAAAIGFVSSVLVGGTAGVFLGLSELGLRSIPAVLVGGLDSIPGALIGGFIVGIVESVATGYFGAGLGHIMPFIVLLLLLLIKPYGLFGEVRIERL